jgi:hypothetical protein
MDSPIRGTDVIAKDCSHFLFRSDDDVVGCYYENEEISSFHRGAATEAVALQILLRPGVDAIECFLDVLD